MDSKECRTCEDKGLCGGKFADECLIMAKRTIRPGKRHNGLHLIIESETYGHVEIAGTYRHRDGERTFYFDYFDGGKEHHGVFERDEWTIKS